MFSEQKGFRAQITKQFIGIMVVAERFKRLISDQNNHRCSCCNPSHQRRYRVRKPDWNYGNLGRAFATVQFNLNKIKRRNSNRLDTCCRGSLLGASPMP